MMMNRRIDMFKKAERKKARLRLAICAPSGAGKTYSALLIGQGLGGKIAMIDTERGSGELYSNLCEYDVCQVSPPYTPQKYIDAIHGAEQAGYNVIIIDSLTHAWAGEGGLLAEVDKRKGRGNDFTAWRDITPQHNALVDAMLQSKCHIIATMRTKQEYVLVEEVRNGKTVKVPKKVGMAPVQRDGMEYEFTVVFDIDLDRHMASASKDRTSLFDGKFFTPSIETGKELVEWLESGAESPAPAAPQMVQPQVLKPPVQLSPMTDAQRKGLMAHFTGRKMSRDERIAWANKFFETHNSKTRITSFTELSERAAAAMLTELDTVPAAAVGE